MASRLLDDFAEQTGLTARRPAERYLWTDAFAVCTLCALDRVDLALRLVDQVHRDLGRHRSDDERHGWLSGLPDQQATEHPTQGGLRIGKPLPERPSGQPEDERLEWDRDGQYFHYLTQWMHALDVVAGRTGDQRLNVWARELAETAWRAFTYEVGPGRFRMHWKMSVDLTRPIVASMGHHDPLDGLLTALELTATASAHGWEAGPDLRAAVEAYAAMLPADLATPDALGIGGLLRDSWRAERLRRSGHFWDPQLERRLIDDSVSSLDGYLRRGELELPARHRLAFRELGLAIGLAAVDRLDAARAGPLRNYLPIRAQIEAAWLADESRATDAWVEHANINGVMLATSLVPSGYLRLD